MATVSGTIALLILFTRHEGTALADSLSWLIPTEPGAGMALMFVWGGLLGISVGLGGYVFTAVRYVETTLPDHDAITAIT